MMLGHERLVDFPLDPLVLHLDHGSFGSAPRSVLEHKREMENKRQFNSQKWFRVLEEQILNNSRSVLAKRLGCDVSQLYLTDNEAYCASSVLLSLKWGKGEGLLITSLASSATRTAVELLKQQHQIVLLEVDFTLQELANPEATLTKVRQFIEGVKIPIRVAIIEHVSACPSFVLPVTQISHELQLKNIEVIVDGVHAVGTVPVSLEQIAPSAYFSSLERWNMLPRSVGLLYLSKKWIQKIKPMVTGNFMGEGPARQYYWTGTRDQTAATCIEEAFQYIDSLGQEKIMKHCHSLALQAGQKVAEIWQTRVWNVNETTVGPMINVESPIQDQQQVKVIAKKLLQQGCSVCFGQYQGLIFCRLSAAIYNQLGDYEKMAHLFLDSKDHQALKEPQNFVFESPEGKIQIEQRPFGHSWKTDFSTDPTFTNINHGSFGCVPKVVTKYQRALQTECEKDPASWFNQRLQPMMNRCRKAAGKMVNCSYQNLMILPNASECINVLMKSMRWQQGDTVVMSNTAYKSIDKTIHFLQNQFKFTILPIEFTVDDCQNPDFILQKIKNTINSSNRHIRLAVFDHISSFPALNFPVAAISTFLREKGIMFFVDAAHAIGNVPIDLQEINPTAYFSNFHKWAFAPKSSAFLYVANEFMANVKPRLSGRTDGYGPYFDGFWSGCRDYVPYLCTEKGLEYLECLGPQRVTKHIHELALAAAKRVAEVWGTELLSAHPDITTSLVNIRSPYQDQQIVSNIAFEMLEEDNCWPTVSVFNGTVYCRISAQIYNQIEDYQFGAITFLKHVERHSKTE